MRALPLVLVATALASLSAPSAAHGQQSDEEWLARCEEDRWQSDRERACELRELGFTPGAGPLAIDAGQNGGIAIRGWDRDSVAVTARIQADAPTAERAREVVRAIRVTAGSDGIRTDGPSARSTGWAVSFVVYVPHRSAVDAETHNGPISARDVAGELTVSTPRRRTGRSR